MQTGKMQFSMRLNIQPIAVQPVPRKSSLRIYSRGAANVSDGLSLNSCRAHVDATAHVIICESGHHRSAAFVELLARYLHENHPGLAIWIWHLDHYRRHRETHREVCNLQVENYLEFPLVNAIESNRSHSVPKLHEHFRRRNDRRRRR